MDGCDFHDVAHPKASLLKKTQELEVAFQIVVTDKSLFKNIFQYVLLSYLKTSKTKKGFENLTSWCV